ncbi:MAG TPA: beta-N-acetylhexosaminidase [Methylovirgula sp.]|nr:beta-N-acetylhexosaminidase [Methylovirgula sp.]
MTRAFVCGCSGMALTREERDFLRESEPFGLILFKRNVETPDQVRSLIESFRDCLGDADAAVLVDQEGGSVQRLGPPFWRAYPAAARFGALNLPIERKEKLVRLTGALIGQDLRRLGASIDCAPVLDVPAQGSHGVIGDRAYARDPQIVAKLGRAAALGLIDGGVLPVMKHIPGHGRASVDSHFGLPIIMAPLEVLSETDFLPFAANADLPIAMTAHVVYTAIDRERPATLSAPVIEYIRNKIGFSGLLLSDDLSMQALSGSLRDRTEAAFAAGIDIALHCNGDLPEAAAVATAAPVLAGQSLARASGAAEWRSEAASFDPVEAWAEIEAALAIVA